MRWKERYLRCDEICIPVGTKAGGLSGRVQKHMYLAAIDWVWRQDWGDRVVEAQHELAVAR